MQKYAALEIIVVKAQTVPKFNTKEIISNLSTNGVTAHLRTLTDESDIRDSKDFKETISI